MQSKVLARWEALIKSTTERLDGIVAKMVKDTAILTDTGVFDDLAAYRYNLAARVYCHKHLQELLENMSVEAAHKEMFAALSREIIGQSTNDRLNTAYKNALVDMYNDLQYSMGV